jgi:hypothetical protein
MKGRADRSLRESRSRVCIRNRSTHRTIGDHDDDWVLDFDEGTFGIIYCNEERIVSAMDVVCDPNRYISTDSENMAGGAVDS